MLRRICRRSTAFVVALGLFFSPGSAAADPADEPNKLHLTPELLTLKGEVGLWFPIMQSERILNRLEQAEAMEALIGAQESLIDTQKDAIKTSTTALAKSEELTDALEAQAEAYDVSLRDTELRLADAKEELASPLRPVLWGSLGGAIGIGIGVVLMLILHQPTTVVVDK